MTAIREARQQARLAQAEHEAAAVRAEAGLLGVDLEVVRAPALWSGEVVHLPQWKFKLKGGRWLLSWWPASGAWRDHWTESGLVSNPMDLIALVRRLAGDIHDSRPDG